MHNTVTRFGLIPTLAVTAMAAPRYSLEGLGQLGGTTSDATSINDAGSVAGKALDALARNRIFLWQSGAGMQDLGRAETFPGPNINNLDQIFGVPNGGDWSLWESGLGWRSLNSINDDGLPVFMDVGTSMGLLNDSGVVAGQLDDSSTIRTLLWSSDVGYTTLPNDALSFTFTRAFNNGGDTGGVGDGLAWIRPAGGTMQVIPYPEPAADYVLGEIHAVNDLGDAIGFFSRIDFSNEIFLRTADGTVDVLLTVTEWPGARALTSDGAFLLDLDGVSHVWDPATQALYPIDSVLDDTAAGWSQFAARDMNNAGQIVGQATNPMGHLEAFLLTPIDCQGDIDADGDSDLDDLLLVLGSFGLGAGGDADADGDTDLDDLLLVLGSLGTC